MLAGGERVDGFRVAYTPGHASHHVSYLHEATGTAFVGDVGGVRIDGGPIVPPTPPPGHRPRGLARVAGPRRRLEPATPGRHPLRRLRRRAGPARGRARGRSRAGATSRAETDTEGYGERFAAYVREHSPDERLAASYLQAMPPETLWPGLDRYWQQRSSG